MNIKKYLQLSDQKLCELENKYTHIPQETEIDELQLSYDKQCLKETILIAKQKQYKRATIKNELRLRAKRLAAIRSLFIRGS